MGSYIWYINVLANPVDQALIEHSVTDGQASCRQRVKRQLVEAGRLRDR